QVQLQESGPGLVRPSETLSLACGVSYGSVDHYYWSWVRQPPGKGLEWIGYIDGYDGATNYSPSLKNRVTITIDTPNQFSLKMTSVSAADTAVYFCGRWNLYDDDHAYKSLAVWGRGILVVVSS
uniref:Anti-HIV-1 ENV immunoglobulin heavy chain variable region n=1 Tax=Macaca mulatta TaxID=9544 RepID=UPI003D18FC8D